MSVPAVVSELGRRAKTAAARLAGASTAEKNAALGAAADLLVDRTGEILAANAADLEDAAAAGMEPGPLDRLRLTDARVSGMAEGLRDRPVVPERSLPASRSSGSGYHSVWSPSSTRTARTLRAMRPASASSRATRRSCAAPPPRCGRTSRSWRRYATRRPRRDSPRIASCSSTMFVTRPPSS